MSKPAFVHYDTPAEYKQYYIKHYCREKIFTFDGVRVKFEQSQFAHAFYEASKKDGKKDNFSLERARRIDWIKATLENPKADIYQGRDKRTNLYNNNRRISVVYENFVVIIDITKKGAAKNPISAKFVTAYPADQYAIAKIRNSPRWNK